MKRRRVLATGGFVVAGGFAGCTLREESTAGGDEGRLDERGDIDVFVDGEPFDLTADRFQAEHADHAMEFHLHEYDENWHSHGDEYVTVGEGMDLLPNFSYDRDDGYHRLVIDDAYDERDRGTELVCFVDGELVNPGAFELQDGDDLFVAVTAARSA